VELGSPFPALLSPPRRSRTATTTCASSRASTRRSRRRDTTDFPFGIWFANPGTLYVAEEGDGSATFDPATDTYTDAAAQATAGRQKWVFDGTKWNLAYTMQNGLSLGTPYVVPGYPTGNNAATGLPWAPATDGMRNINGRVSPNGTATIYGVTSTVSGSGDQGADPNKVVAITDELGGPLAGERELLDVQERRLGTGPTRGGDRAPRRQGLGQTAIRAHGDARRAPGQRESRSARAAAAATVAV
jgi:hypothetical protein